MRRCDLEMGSINFRVLTDTELHVSIAISEHTSSSSVICCLQYRTSDNATESVTYDHIPDHQRQCKQQWNWNWMKQLPP